MLGLIGWLVLGFYPRYWLAATFSVLFGGMNVLMSEQMRPYSPDLANSLFDSAILLTITFVVIAFGIVFIRKMIWEMKAKTNQQLAAILARAKAKSE